MLDWRVDPGILRVALLAPVLALAASWAIDRRASQPTQLGKLLQTWTLIVFLVTSYGFGLWIAAPSARTNPAGPTVTGTIVFSWVLATLYVAFDRILATATRLTTAREPAHAQSLQTRFDTFVRRMATRTGLTNVVDEDTIVRIVAFCLVGASGIPVDIGITTLIYVAGGHYLLANVVGYLVAVTWNFSWNYTLTWNRPPGSVLVMYGKYLGADIGLFAIRVGVVAGLVELVGVHPLVATLVGIGAVAAATYAVADGHIFDGTPDNEEGAA